MRATITRSGGFAGITLRREVDLSHAQIEQLRASGEEPATPDAFSYEVSVGGETFTVRGANAEPLLDPLLRAE